MAASTGKRKFNEDKPVSHASVKRANLDVDVSLNGTPKQLYAKKTQDANGAAKAGQNNTIGLQIVTGSYERVLQGVYAEVPLGALQETDQTTPNDDPIDFSNTFLFTAHTSSIRCLALSPPTGLNKRTLATGSSDERINLYSISTDRPPKHAKPLALPSLESTPIAENSTNRSLGTLSHHERAISCLHFPTKSKLFSAAEDNAIAISRTRDWTVLSSIKAPIPKPQGRPSGDTAGPGEVPAGVNDFAVHPSQKLMLSVGRGERCMRLWNLMTGKKAGVLNFDRELLAQVGEGKAGYGEGRRVLWAPDGENFLVGFERAAALFGMDSKPKAIIRPSPPTKLHQMHLVPQMGGILAVSTEDGRILFYDTTTVNGEPDTQKLPFCDCVAQLGGAAAGISGRVKDFEVLPLVGTAGNDGASCLVVTGSSDGAIRVWTVRVADLRALDHAGTNGEAAVGQLANGSGKQPREVGDLVGTLETGNRITCLAAFATSEKAATNGIIVDNDTPADDGADD